MCTIRNSHRWRASVITLFGENGPRVVMPTYPAAADLGVDCVGNALVLEQPRDGAVDRLCAIDVELILARAEAGPAKQMLDLRVEDEGHQSLPGRWSIESPHRVRDTVATAVLLDPWTGSTLHAPGRQVTAARGPWAARR